MSTQFTVSVRASGSNANGVWVVPRSLPLHVATQLVEFDDLTDFASVVDADGKPVATAIPAGGTLTVSAVNVRRFHRKLAEGDGYSAAPSHALEFVLA